MAPARQRRLQILASPFLLTPLPYPTPEGAFFSTPERMAVRLPSFEPELVNMDKSTILRLPGAWFLEHGERPFTLARSVPGARHFSFVCSHSRCYKAHSAWLRVHQA